MPDQTQSGAGPEVPRVPDLDTADEPQLEYRIGWNASSNASFRGASDWTPANEGETRADIENALYAGSQDCEGLGMALEYSGFDWWVETRESEELIA
jgi:hypothetical protein